MITFAENSPLQLINLSSMFLFPLSSIVLKTLKMYPLYLYTEASFKFGFCYSPIFRLRDFVFILSSTIYPHHHAYYFQFSLRISSQCCSSYFIFNVFPQNLFSDFILKKIPQHIQPLSPVSNNQISPQFFPWFIPNRSLSSRPQSFYIFTGWSMDLYHISTTKFFDLLLLY